MKRYCIALGVFIPVLLIGSIFLKTDMNHKRELKGGKAIQSYEIKPNTEESPLRTEEPVSAVSEGKMLTLVNPWNEIPKDYTVSLVELGNGHSVDRLCYPALQNMMDDCCLAGFSPVICSSYRTWQKQERLYLNKVYSLMQQGYTEDEAKIKAAGTVAVPGTSEHQLGLAVDIVDANNQNLDESQESTAVQKWLMENSWKYGFILRYPNGKSEITGIIYEPWHYRYVGKEAAEEIYRQGICLEEYLDRVDVTRM